MDVTVLNDLSLYLCYVSCRRLVLVRLTMASMNIIIDRILTIP